MRYQSHRTCLFLLTVIGFVGGSLLAEALADQPATPPNILLVFLDDFGWMDTSYMGSDFYETPHIDKLAGQSMVFTNAYSCSANCAPARASLLSGQYTPRHQVYNVGTRPRGKSAHRRLEHIPGVDTLDPKIKTCLLYTSPSPRDATLSRMPSSA